MTAAILIVLSLIALLWLALLLSPAHRETFSVRLDADTKIDQPPEGFPPVIVIVPARNEAAMLPQTIPTICRQDYPNLQVILVDDQSEDNSPVVIEKLKQEHPNLISIRAADRPAGWMGKCWAIQQAIDFLNLPNSQLPNSNSALLLFTDADVIYHPQAVRQAVKMLHDRKLDMLSLAPRCICVGLLERISVGGLISILTMLFPLGWVNDPNKKWAVLACGGFILVRPEAYDKIGGHHCVKSEMIEDINLAKHLKQSGALIACRMTRDLLTSRMYEGFADLWEGLTKNAYAGMEYRPRKFWVGLVVGLFVSVFPPIYLVLTTIWAIRTQTSASIIACGLAILINLCMILIQARGVRHLQFPWIDVFFMPLSAGMYNLIAIDSFRQHHFGGGNMWKGRRYERAMLIGAATQKES